MEDFFKELCEIEEEDQLLNFCRKKVLHGIPKLFEAKEELFYDFRKRIADKFKIDYHEVLITGSAKLGFSPHKRRGFDFDSDIDVAIISTALYENIMEKIYEYQMALRESRKLITERELQQYHKFLEYTAIGWIRPDLLPLSFKIEEFKTEWFDFFQSISYGNSEVGNYKVTAGVFKNYKFLELYSMSNLRSIKKAEEIKKFNG